jgi:hypothetical protein
VPAIDYVGRTVVGGRGLGPANGYPVSASVPLARRVAAVPGLTGRSD